MNNFTPFPSSDEALRDLEDFLPVLWEAMDSAVTGAASFFSGGVPVDASLFPNLVRYYAKGSFANHNLDAEDEETPAKFESVGLANNGLCVISGRYALRIRKSDNGQVPPPGPSFTLRQFYRQQPLPFNRFNMPAQAVDTSLLVLWNVDSLHRLAGLELSCPREGADTQSSVKVYWSVPLLSPLITQKEVGPRAVDDLEGMVPISEPGDSRQSG
jgi:hypothetical protein